MAKSKNQAKEPTGAGERLKKSREHKGLTQFDLSEEVGVTPRTIARWESEESAPSLGAWALLAARLHVAPVWLTSGLGPRTLDELRLQMQADGDVDDSEYFASTNKPSEAWISRNQNPISPSRRLALNVLQDDLHGIADKVAAMTDDELAEFADAVRKALAKKR